ncbi:MAG: D-glycerate dehydrogenase, partial [Acidimicrobiales bacterium]
MARVLVTRRLTPGGTDPLLEAGHEIVGPDDDDVPLTQSELEAGAADSDGIVCLLTDRIDAAVLEAGHAGRLRVVANAAVGYDNIDVARAHALGIAVCNTPGVLDATTADLAFLLILTATRNTSTAEDDLRHGRWDGWGFGTHLAHDVHGKTLG